MSSLAECLALKGTVAKDIPVLAPGMDEHKEMDVIGAGATHATCQDLALI